MQRHLLIQTKLSFPEKPKGLCDSLPYKFLTHCSIALQNAVQNGGAAIQVLKCIAVFYTASTILNERKNSELAAPYLNTKLFPAL